MHASHSRYERSRRSDAPSIAAWLTALASTLCLISAAAFSAEGSTSASKTDGEDSVRPGINDRFLSPDLDVDHWVETFEGESREVFRERGRIVDALPLAPGTRVADIGAGTGLFTWPMAERVTPKGKVYAIEISPRFVDLLRKRSAERGLSQVRVVEGNVRSIDLPEGSLDLVFLCDTYHHFEYPEAMLASIHRALRPGGVLVVIDFERIEGKSPDWILEHMRAGRETFQSEIAAAGFTLEEKIEIEGLQENYMLRFQRP